MIYIIIDILIGNYTKYFTFFFLSNLNNKSYIYNLSCAIFLDCLVLKTYCLNIIIISIFYIIHKWLFKKAYLTYFKYVICNLIFPVLYYLITSSIFSYINFKSFISVIIIHLIFYSISYIKSYPAYNYLGEKNEPSFK